MLSYPIPINYKWCLKILAATGDEKLSGSNTDMVNLWISSSVGRLLEFKISKCMLIHPFWQRPCIENLPQLAEEIPLYLGWMRVDAVVLLSLVDNCFRIRNSCRNRLFCGLLLPPISLGSLIIIYIVFHCYRLESFQEFFSVFFSDFIIDESCPTRWWLLRMWQFYLRTHLELFLYRYFST